MSGALWGGALRMFISRRWRNATTMAHIEQFDSRIFSVRSARNCCFGPVLSFSTRSVRSQHAVPNRDWAIAAGLLTPAPNY